MVEAVEMLVEFEDFSVVDPDPFEETVAVQVGVIGGRDGGFFNRGDLSVEPNEHWHSQILPGRGPVDR